MIHRTLLSAQREPGPFASWKSKVILRVTLADGRQFFRTYVFDTYLNPCKRCRKADRGRGKNPRLAATGHTCEICSNPYAGFVRQGVRKTDTGHEVMRHCWCNSGRLH